ncbi:MAG: septation protein A [Candidatus Liberibacter europaeus]|uniref:Inner membrane-spanning protein YciB n=1 Tax=Candidatus Liberibacter europaeus TaxID=744859 RepID=A0A2T4VXM1_9HYPH|nr:septation protein A [Candidatus Liberibacter europaeus]PTL86511.1 MAG: septation protein A [Candidatus Liberibacter europaeus]
MKLSPSKNKCVSFLLEFGPLIVFWLFNYYGQNLLIHYPILSNFGEGIFLSTVFFVIATGLSLLISWFLFHEISKISLISGIFVIILGSLTVWFRDERFIKIKPTILYCLFSAILFIGYVFGKNFLRLFLFKIIRLDGAGWDKLTVRWAVFFLFLAFLNELVWRNFSTEMWITFKTIGIFPIVLVFGIAQVNLMNKHAVSSKEDYD